MRLALAGGVAHFVEHFPGDDAHAGGTGVVGQRRGNVEVDEPAEQPAGQHPLIRGVRANQPPVFFFRSRSLTRGFLRRCIGVRAGAGSNRIDFRRLAGEQVERDIFVQLADPGSVAARREMKVAENAGVAASLNRHVCRRGLEIFQQLPQIGGEQVVFLHPSDQAFGRANFHLLLKTLQNFHAFAERNHADGCADLRRSAPNHRLFISAVGNFQRSRRMTKTKVQADHDHEQERAAQQNFSGQERTPWASQSAPVTIEIVGGRPLIDEVEILQQPARPAMRRFEGQFLSPIGGFCRLVQFLCELISMR